MRPRLHRPLRKSKQMPFSSEFTAMMWSTEWEYLQAAPRVHIPFVKSKHIWRLSSCASADASMLGLGEGLEDRASLLRGGLNDMGTGNTGSEDACEWIGEGWGVKGRDSALQGLTARWVAEGTRPRVIPVGSMGAYQRSRADDAKPARGLPRCSGHHTRYHGSHPRMQLGHLHRKTMGSGPPARSKRHPCSNNDCPRGVTQHIAMLLFETTQQQHEY